MFFFDLYTAVAYTNILSNNFYAARTSVTQYLAKQSGNPCKRVKQGKCTTPFSISININNNSENLGLSKLSEKANSYTTHYDLLVLNIVLRMDKN